MTPAWNPVDVFEVETPYAGRLSVCMRPRGGMWLDSDIKRLRAAGWDVLVSALMPREVEELQLAATEQHCAELGIEYVPFPIGNLQVPAIEEAVPRFEMLRERLIDGLGVTAHCNGSIGRAPLIVASLLVLGGVEPGDAWTRIREARCEQVPDTPEQRDWVARLADLALHG